MNVNLYHDFRNSLTVGKLKQKDKGNKRAINIGLIRVARHK